MSTFNNAGEIAASFTKFYFEALTKPNSAELLAGLYGDNSCVNYVSSPVAAAPEAYQGKAQIVGFLNNMQVTLGERKVNVRHVDYVAADTNVAITCSGYVYTRGMSRVFTQTFVLAPTKYRTNCFYIVGDSLRFLSEEVETIPQGFVSAEEYDALVAARAAEEAKEAEEKAAAAAARKAKETPAAAAPAPAAVVTAAPVAVAAPVAAPATSAAHASAPADRVRKPLTSYVRILQVPEEIQLSAVGEACAKFGTVTDRYWLHDVDCIVAMAKPAEARQIVRLSGRFRIKAGGPFKVEFFYPESA